MREPSMDEAPDLAAAQRRRVAESFVRRTVNLNLLDAMPPNKLAASHYELTCSVSALALMGRGQP